MYSTKNRLHQYWDMDEEECEKKEEKASRIIDVFEEALFGNL